MKKFLLLCAMCAPGLAAALPGDEWYVTPMAGGISPDYRRDLRDHDWVYGAALGKELNQWFNAELNFNFARINDGRGQNHLNEFAGTFDVLGVLNRQGRFAPFLDLGVGALQSDYIHQDDTTKHLMTQAGIGTFINLWRSKSGTGGFALRPEILARFDMPGLGHGHVTDYVAMLGLQYSFGGSSNAPPPAPPAPPPPPVAEAAPAPAAVPGPPPDSDHDGVPDNIDQCPDTPAGVQVDAVGCPLKGSIVLEGVNFKTNSAELTVASQPALNTVAEGLKKHPRLKVEIQGHTDSTGSAPYNLSLSQKRADAVRTYLVQGGANPEQLQTKGYGQNSPVAENTTVAGRAQNRRVVMFVVSNPGEVKVEGAGTTPDSPPK